MKLSDAEEEAIDLLNRGKLLAAARAIENDPAREGPWRMTVAEKEAHINKLHDVRRARMLSR